MTTIQPYSIKSITEYHRLTSLPKPGHPLISVIDLSLLAPQATAGPLSLSFDFYTIALKKELHTTIKYGQQTCDFDEGMLFCTAPGQILSFDFSDDPAYKSTGWMILIHLDFLWNTPLSKNIKKHEYFRYSVYEALYLSDKEEQAITGIAKSIEQEYHATIDQFSQSVIIAQLEVLLTYAERFYRRQFITRQISSHQLISRVEEIINAYFDNEALSSQGLLSVSTIANELNVSPNYLSEMLKAITGQNTQQHIHHHLIERAKEKLSATNLSVSEIAYGLGFEHIQSFSKLFKAKTTLTPVEFRTTFN